MEIKKNKLVITEKEGVICYGYFQDGVPTELYCEPKEQQSILGNIYAARVERVAEGIHGAFLEIGDNQKCYYSLSAELPESVHRNQRTGRKVRYAHPVFLPSPQ